MFKLGDSLLETHKIITGERQDSYGNPENCFPLIAEFWNAYLLEIEKKLLPILKPIDVTNLMILFKVARLLGQKPTRDTYLDIQGYAAIAADVLLKTKGD